MHLVLSLELLVLSLNGGALSADSQRPHIADGKGRLNVALLAVICSFHNEELVIALIWLLLCVAYSSSCPESIFNPHVCRTGATVCGLHLLAKCLWQGSKAHRAITEPNVSCFSRCCRCQGQIPTYTIFVPAQPWVTCQVPKAEAFSC